MMTNVDELTDNKHLCMTFTEFVEAIGRVAAQLEIPHPLEVSNSMLNTVVFVTKGRCERGS